MKGKLVKIYGMRDPGLEAKRNCVSPVPGIPIPEDDVYECILIPAKPFKDICPKECLILKNYSA
jgi:hypothetical protein